MAVVSTAGIVVLLALAILPLRTVTEQVQLVNNYSVSVQPREFGTVPINHAFLGLCDEGWPQLRLMGNQTIWLEWRVVSGAEPYYVDLFETPGSGPTEPYNTSGVRQGGFAQSAPAELESLCESNPIFSAFSNTSSVVQLEVGLIYSHEAKVAVL